MECKVLGECKEWEECHKVECNNKALEECNNNKVSVECNSHMDLAECLKVECNNNKVLEECKEWEACNKEECKEWVECKE